MVFPHQQGCPGKEEQEKEKEGGLTTVPEGAAEEQPAIWARPRGLWSMTNLVAKVPGPTSWCQLIVSCFNRLLAGLGARACQNQH